MQLKNKMYFCHRKQIGAMSNKKIIILPDEVGIDDVLKLPCGMAYFSSTLSDVGLVCLLNRLLNINLQRVKSPYDIKRINDHYMPNIAVYHCSAIQHETFNIENPNECFLLVNKQQHTAQKPIRRKQMQLFFDFDQPLYPLDPQEQQITELLAGKHDFLFIAVGQEALTDMQERYANLLHQEKLNISPLYTPPHFADYLSTLQYVMDLCESQNIDHLQQLQHIRINIIDHPKTSGISLHELKDYIKETTQQKK